MHIITIGCAPLAMQFVFKNKETANAAWAACDPGDELLSAEGSKSTLLGKIGRVTITDDFGQIGEFSKAAMTSRTIEDCDLSKRAHIERSLHQQRMQTDFQKAAESDPHIRAAMRGPAVIAPMGFNGRGN